MKLLPVGLAFLRGAVEAEYMARYPVDGKPFVPSYNRPPDEANEGQLPPITDQTQGSNVPGPRGRR